MKVLIIGYGSIGKRHAEIMEENNKEVTIFTSRQLKISNKIINAWDEIHDINYYDYIIVANETSKHLSTLKRLTELNYSGKIMVEKPLFNDYCNDNFNHKQNIFIGYNLRFHPIIRKIKTLIKEEKILSIQCYTGQYLPTWRPGTDYKKSYSADVKKGGGVLRDLSHELDYVLSFTNGWNDVTALGGHFSKLEIQSDDTFTILLSTPLCPSVSVQINYLDKICQREIIINTDNFTIKADLVNHLLNINGNIEKFNLSRNDTYELMHKDILNDQYKACTYFEGLEVMNLINSIEEANKRKEWIHNEKNLYYCC